jgi:hypothetical protein
MNCFNLTQIREKKMKGLRKKKKVVVVVMMVVVVVVVTTTTWFCVMMMAWLGVMIIMSSTS